MTKPRKLLKGAFIIKASILTTIRQSFNHVAETDSRAKIGPRAFVIALVTAIACDKQGRSIANLRRQIGSSLGEIIARSSFWQRLSSERLTSYLCQTIRELVKGLTTKLDVGNSIIAALGVRAIYLLDSSSISLPRAAKIDFPAPRKNVIPAALKWHLCWNLFSGIGEWCCVTDAKTHDRKIFPPIEVLKDALIVFDLGYWDYQLLADLMKNGCYFLSRVKSKALINITAIPSRSQWRYPLGKNLFSINWKKSRGSIIELIGTVSLGDDRNLDLRTIGFWNPADKIYHWYVTNLSIPARMIYPLYRIRWQIELVFKAAKSSMCLSDIKSSNSNIILNLVLSSIAINLIAMPIAKDTLRCATVEIQLANSIQRAGKILASIAPDLTKFLIYGTSELRHSLMKKLLLFIKEFVDPNYKNRPSSLQILGLLT